MRRSDGISQTIAEVLGTLEADSLQILPPGQDPESALIAGSGRANYQFHEELRLRRPDRAELLGEVGHHPVELDNGLRAERRIGATVRAGAVCSEAVGQVRIMRHSETATQAASNRTTTPAATVTAMPTAVPT
ncbi:hypothetical protein [Curtobacterium sp. MR_MD2014]|uniref:hypothetical protein n=1 Tax=Curtobacterium sp. MR_MD2014 TaxID=1561023 RepID=UPI001185004B|nr:hypothetical protein [Curtobacterium sp. MR_MD2014]